MKYALILLVATVAISAGVAGPAGASSEVANATPPDGIYTCAWIAANPTAATLARVSCSPDMINVGSSVMPSQVPALPLAQGCQRVPSSGSIGTDVFAATTFEYSNDWSWSAPSQSEQYFWHIRKTDGTDQVSEYNGGTGDGPYFVPANDYQWKVQNLGNDPQYWSDVCYTVA